MGRAAINEASNHRHRVQWELTTAEFQPTDIILQIPSVLMPTSLKIKHSYYFRHQAIQRFHSWSLLVTTKLTCTVSAESAETIPPADVQ